MTPMNALPRCRAAFTFAELLAVVAIMAIIAALLIPSLMAVQHRAQLLQCQSNLHQLGVAAQIFATDSGGFLPRDAFSASQAFFAPRLAKVIRLPQADESLITIDLYTGPRIHVDLDYCVQWLRPLKVFKCPAVRDDRYVLHYAVNSMDFHTAGSSGDFRETPWQKSDAIRNIHRSAYLVECNMTTLPPEALGQFNIYRADDLPYYFTPPARAGRPTPRPRMISSLDSRHQGKTALLFFDWHVETRNLTLPGDWPESVLNPFGP